MAVWSYTDKEGKTMWAAAIKVRSKHNRKIVVQKKRTCFKSSEEAERALKRLRDEAVRELAERENFGKSWRSLINAWENALLQGDGILKRVTAGTVQDYVGPVRKYTNEWMDRPASLLKRTDVRRILAHVGSTVSPIRADKLKGFMASAFRWAIDADFDQSLTESPVRGVRVEGLNRRDKRPDILTGEEIRRLLECAKTLETPWYPIWSMAVMTGMRSGELYALLWTDVDFESDQISVNKSFSKRAMVKERERYPDGIKGTKTEGWRNIPISDDLRAFLIELRNHTGATGHVLPRLKAWGNSLQAAHLKAFCESIGLKPIVFHALRACFAVQLLQTGVPSVTVMAIGGWEDMKTMMKYVRMAGVDTKGATQNLKLLPAREAIAKVIRLPGGLSG